MRSGEGPKVLLGAIPSDVSLTVRSIDRTVGDAAVFVDETAGPTFHLDRWGCAWLRDAHRARVAGGLVVEVRADAVVSAHVAHGAKLEIHGVPDFVLEWEPGADLSIKDSFGGVFVMGP